MISVPDKLIAGETVAVSVRVLHDTPDQLTVSNEQGETKALSLVLRGSKLVTLWRVPEEWTVATFTYPGAADVSRSIARAVQAED